MVKAIFFDIDGTLVSFKNHQIPKSTFDALYKLKEKGIKLFIATGRGKDGLDVLNDFPFDGYITLNGQYCYTNNQIIYSNTIQKEDLQALQGYDEHGHHRSGAGQPRAHHHSRRAGGRPGCGGAGTVLRCASGRLRRNETHLHHLHPHHRGSRGRV